MIRVEMISSVSNDRNICPIKMRIKNNVVSVVVIRIERKPKISFVEVKESKSFFFCFFFG